MSAGQSHRARKRFGQHFLIDTGIIDQMIVSLGLQPSDRVLEIGPGLGAMTRPLAQQLPRLTVVELDRDLAQRLRAWPNLEVIESDVLAFDLSIWAKSEQTPCALVRVVGNLPYNVSSPILFHLLDHVSVVQDQLFMLQNEVIERMIAPVGGAEYSRLSVMLQWRYDMRKVLFVPPEAFDPPPRVDSAVVHMSPRSLDQLSLVPGLTEKDMQDKLGQVLLSAFSQRRKLLRHTLGAWLQAQNFQGQFDVQRRAQEVSVAEYVALARQLLQAAG